MTDLKIIETGDGSPSIYNRNLNETYHSHHGAITESMHVFIKQGLEYFYESSNCDKINVFEVGFGTGLNALLSLRWCMKHNTNLYYHAIEKYPLPVDLVDQIKYSEPALTDEFKKLHHLPWNEEVLVNDCFYLTKILKDWTTYEPDDQCFHLIFYDAFAPSRQLIMWEKELLVKCHNTLRPGGTLVTYCAQGQLKRNLKEIGFLVETIPGPPGKKEMTRAIKPS